MTDRVDPAETLAYVDDWLDPEARSAFAARLQADPELRREVARWESQNRAIRAAFGAPSRSPLDLGDASNENVVRRSAEPARSVDGAARPFGQARNRSATAAPVVPPRRAGPGSTTRRLAGAVALAAAIVWVGLPFPWPAAAGWAPRNRRGGGAGARRSAG